MAKYALANPPLQKNGPGDGAISLRVSRELVVPVVTTPDDDHSVAIMLVPAAVQPAVMSIELGTRTAEVIAVAIVVPVASDPEPETFSARYRRRCNRDGCQRGENVRHLLHVASPLVAQGKRLARRDVPGTGQELS